LKNNQNKIDFLNQRTFSRNILKKNQLLLNLNVIYDATPTSLKKKMDTDHAQPYSNDKNFKPMKKTSVERAF
jgi:hypothetical protein